MTIKEAKDKTNMLAEMLPAVYEVLKDLFVDAKQIERFIDFKHEVLAIADGEISYSENYIRMNEEIKARQNGAKA